MFPNPPFPNSFLLSKSLVATDNSLAENSRELTAVKKTNLDINYNNIIFIAIYESNIHVGTGMAIVMGRLTSTKDCSEEWLPSVPS